MKSSVRHTYADALGGFLILGQLKQSIHNRLSSAVIEYPGYMSENVEEGMTSSSHEIQGTISVFIFIF